MDREAWWATAHGVTKSRIQLKWLSTHVLKELTHQHWRTEIFRLKDSKNEWKGIRIEGSSVKVECTRGKEISRFSSKEKVVTGKSSEIRKASLFSKTALWSRSQCRNSSKILKENNLPPTTLDSTKPSMKCKSRINTLFQICKVSGNLPSQETEEEEEIN